MQTGQVILTCPYQMALMGVIPAIIVAIGVGLLNYYTLAAHCALLRAQEIYGKCSPAGMLASSPALHQLWLLLTKLTSQHRMRESA